METRANADVTDLFNESHTSHEQKFLENAEPVSLEAEEFFDPAGDEELDDAAEVETFDDALEPIDYFGLELSTASVEDFKKKLSEFFAVMHLDDTLLAEDRKRWVSELVKKVKLINDEAKQSELLKAAYEHPCFSQHRHLTSFRDILNRAYQKLSTLNCCGFFSNSLQRDLIETRSQKALADCLLAKR